MDISSQIKQDTTTTATEDIQPLGHMQVEQTGFDSQNVAVLTKRPATMPQRNANNVTLRDNFITRPIPLTSGVATIGTYGVVDLFTVTETNFIPPQSFLNITGVTGYKGTLCFSVVFSAPAQVAGVFKLAIVPLSSNSSDSYLHQSNPLILSQVPQVEINLAELNTGTLKYPFTYDASYLRVNPLVPVSYCDLFLYAYIAPTGPSTISSITYTIYQWIEDFETFSPGVANQVAIIPQMDKTEFQAVGPISTVMKYASKITSAIGNAVPLISNYTRPLSWIMNGVGSVAAQFGWSKPNMSTAKTVMAVAGRGYNNCLGVDACQELALYGNNEVMPLSGVDGSDIDQMAFCALTCIPSPIARSILLTTDVFGHFGWTCQVAPACLFFQSNTSGTPWFNQNQPLPSVDVAVIPTPIYALASMFTGWAGDLVFRFKFARTKFMSGRFLIGYNPRPDSQAGEVPNNSRYDFGGEIIDLRTTSTYDLEVPYQYYRDYCPTSFGQLTNTYNTGNVFIQVVDPLIVPPDGPQSVTFIVEVFSKCGLQFVNPTVMSTSICARTTPIFAQMDKGDPRTYVSGEAILSVKQISAKLARTTMGATIVTLSDLAWMYPITATFGTFWSGHCSIFSFFSQSYKFYRGSTVLRMFPNLPATSEVIWSPTTAAADSPLSIENNVVNQVRRPYYNLNKVSRLRPQAGNPVTFEPTRYFIMSSSDIGTSYAIVPGDDFQYSSFVGFGPLVSTLVTFS